MFITNLRITRSRAALSRASLSALTNPIRSRILSYKTTEDRRRAGRGLAAIALIVTALSLWAPNASAEPVFQGVETAISNGSESGLSVDVPAGVTAGDLLIAIWGIAINPSSGTPSGFTPVAPGLAGLNGATCPGFPIDCQLNVFFKIADGTETSVTFGFTGAPGGPRAQIAAVLRYSNVNTSDPIGPFGVDSDSSGSPTAPSINTTEDNSLVLRIALSGAETAAPSLSGGPETSLFNRNGCGNSDICVSMAGSDAVQLAAGNTGSASWTGGADWVATTITIREAQLVVDADLSISKTVDKVKVNPGDTITYTVVASNSGLSNNVFGAEVNDFFPSSLSCDWTCSASEGSSCDAGLVMGDISDTVDLLAGGTATYEAICTVDPTATGTITNVATINSPIGVTDTDTSNNDDSDSTAINQPPNARCADAIVMADNQCRAAASIDDGSFDPDGDVPLMLVHNPSGPYGLGDTLVTLTVTDALGLSDSCQARVLVTDVTAPSILCNAPSSIVPPDAPVSFTATASDNCGISDVEITHYDCTKRLKNGKVISKTDSCIVSLDGDTITIEDSGGVGTSISWMVVTADGSGNTAVESCSLRVNNPGKN